MPPTRRILVVVKCVITSRFMQSVDVFEPGKFVGFLIDASQDQSHWGLAAAEILKRLVNTWPHDVNTEEPVGVIVPGEDAAFLAGHTVISSGQQWITVRDLCRRYQSELPQEQA